MTSLVCAGLNGWASIVIDGTLTVVSAAWFPAGERTTATGIIIAIQMAGLVPPALLFPWLVTEPPRPLDGKADDDGELAEKIRQEVSVILYGEAVLAAALLVVMLLFFPDRPPTPPSKSAASARQNVSSSLKQIFRKPKCVAAGYPQFTLYIMLYSTVATYIAKIALHDSYDCTNFVLQT